MITRCLCISYQFLNMNPSLIVQLRLWFHDQHQWVPVYSHTLSPAPITWSCVSDLAILLPLVNRIGLMNWLKSNADKKEFGFWLHWLAKLMPLMASHALIARSEAWLGAGIQFLKGTCSGPFWHQLLVGPA